MFPVHIKYVGHIHDGIKNVVQHPSCVNVGNEPPIVTIKKLQNSSDTVAEEHCNPEELELLLLLFQLRIQVLTFIE